MKKIRNEYFILDKTKSNKIKTFINKENSLKVKKELEDEIKNETITPIKKEESKSCSKKSI